MITVGGIILGTSTAAALSDATPQPLGTADPGVSLSAARADHVHARSPFLLGPFTVDAIPTGDAAAPEDSTVETPTLLAGLAEIGLVHRAGSITGVIVSLTGDAVGSDARISLYAGEAETPAASPVVVVAAGQSKGRTLVAAGTLPVAQDDGVAPIVQTGSAWSSTTVGAVIFLEITPT